MSATISMTTDRQRPELFTMPSNKTSKTSSSWLIPPVQVKPITLGNQSQEILMSMYGGHSHEVTPLVSPTTSQPIRITTRRTGAQHCLDEEDVASSHELKTFYDQATWRMYHLIQTARMEREAQRVEEAQEQDFQYGHVNTMLGEGDPRRNRSSSLEVVQRAMECVQDEEPEEEIFELDM